MASSSLHAPEFERRVGDVIAEIERTTAAEVVVVVAPRAGEHADVPLMVGTAALFVAFTGLMFAESEVGDYALYLGPFVAFGLGWSLVRWVAPLQRALLGARRRARETEIWARATFQKASLHRTRDATGLLVFFAELEGTCALVCDHGVAAVAAAAEWQALEGKFQRALAAGEDEILTTLRTMGRMLGERLPPRPDDIDELPSHVRVTF